MPASETDRLVHMLHYAEKTIAIARDRTRDQLEKDTTLEFAILHGVQTIGEAAAQISESTRDRHPAIPWAKIIGMRNRLIHGYDSVDHDILWQTVNIALPELIEILLKIIPPEYT
jgi:uncharacterized protein with HEPN domain